VGAGDDEHGDDPLDRPRRLGAERLQTTNVRVPDPIATSVRRKAARSASAWARERDVCACSTSRMMPASAVRSPVPVTSMRSDPSVFTVPAITFAPASFFTGRDSPVIIASFTSLARTARAVRRNAGAGTHQDEVALTKIADRDLLGRCRP
jgi:hypothetical protein